LSRVIDGLLPTPIVNIEFEIMTDQIEDLINQAHDIFNKSSIYEVFDLDNRKEAIEVLREFYDPLDMEKVEKYFAILDKLHKLCP